MKNGDRNNDQDSQNISEVDLVTPSSNEIEELESEGLKQESEEKQSTSSTKSEYSEPSFIARYIRGCKLMVLKGAGSVNDFYKRHEHFIKKNRLYIGLGSGAAVLIIIIITLLLSGHDNQNAQVEAYQRATHQQPISSHINPAKFNNQFAMKKSESIKNQVGQLQAEQNSMNRMMSELSKTQVTLANQTSQLAEEITALKEMGSRDPKVIHNLQASVDQLKGFQKQYEIKLKQLDNSQLEVKSKLSEVVNSRPTKLKRAVGWSVSAATNQTFFLSNKSGEMAAYRVGQDVPSLGVVKGPTSRVLNHNTGQRQEVLLIGKDYFIPITQQVLNQ